ncbi:hypothetical protein MCG98_03610 [Ruminococcus sp. OA3]|uniref:hypothetical protein n=1 Tax=Ruminococcus sp. OA3 TaxID=2914164 RepID=UPI001F06AB11|nr:hypothetical protein [Ruminococcus sp. OA3]MCH1981656.1 hypothetical protein [Ruminococcus sp. OA3]
MKKFSIKAVCAVMTAALGITMMAGCGSKDLDGTQTVASVDQEEVPLGVASFALRYQQAQTEYYYKSIYSMYGMDSSQGMWDQETEDGITYGEQTKNECLATLEKMYLTRAKAEEYNLTITDEEKTAMDEAAKTFIEANDAETLKKIGVTESDVREYLELSTYYKKAYEPVIADVEIEVTDEEAAQSTLTYAALTMSNLEEDAKKEAYSKMETLLENLKAEADPASADIETMAKELDDSFIVTTYSYGEDDTSLDETLKEKAADLEDGQLYDGVVEGESSYFLVRMDKKLDQEATDSKKESIKKEKQQEAFDEIVQGWYDEADITLNKKVWKKVTLTDKESFSMMTPEAAGTSDDGTTGDETETGTEDGAGNAADQGTDGGTDAE